MQSSVGETCWEGVSPYVADIIHGAGYTDDVHDDIILGNITSFIGHTAVPLTLAPSRIAHNYNCAGRNLQPNAQYCNDVSGKLVGTQALCQYMQMYQSLNYLKLFIDKAH